MRNLNYKIRTHTCIIVLSAVILPNGRHKNMRTQTKLDFHNANNAGMKAL